jgi:hypothetical protein
MIYVVRLLLGAFEGLFFLYLTSTEPWRIQHTDPQDYWALSHAWLYMALAICAVACPFPRLLAILCIVGAVALPITGSWARLEWQSGNDGGGFCWLLVVGPTGLLVSIGNMLLGMALLKLNRKRELSGERVAFDLEGGHGITLSDHRR